MTGKQNQGNHRKTTPKENPTIACILHADRRVPLPEALVRFSLPLPEGIVTTDGS